MIDRMSIKNAVGICIATLGIIEFIYYRISCECKSTKLFQPDKINRFASRYLLMYHSNGWLVYLEGIRSGSLGRRLFCLVFAPALVGLARGALL